MSTTTAATEVDAAIWYAVAGATVKIPSTNSFVYYFPQGHMESTSGNIQSSDFAVGCPIIPCQVHSVQFLCSNESDQVFAKIRLQPLKGDTNHCTNGVENRNDDDVVSFVKILSQSDELLCTFNTSEFCLHSIMPPLDSAANELAQNLTIRDTLNKPWTFRYFRPAQWRHFLGDGWITFVVAKHLKAGDSVVFMRKKSTNELFLGIRRAAVGIDGGAAGVVAAIESAGIGKVFEVDYYPRLGSPEFVVGMEKVAAGLRVNWRVGMMVSVAVENQDLSGVTWSQGTVMAVLLPETGQWLPSPWGILKVKCFIPGIDLPKEYRLNPWEVVCTDQNDDVGSSIQLFGATIQRNSDDQETNVPANSISDDVNM